MYYVYILKCCDGSLYTGITTDVIRRVREHYYKTPKGAKYTKSHGVKALEAVWTASDKGSALKTEHFIKALPREKKIELILSGEDIIDCQRIYGINLDKILST